MTAPWAGPRNSPSSVPTPSCPTRTAWSPSAASRSPAEVESPYIIRVAIALLMVAASIPGRSVIRNATPIRRAHPHFAENIGKLGVRVEWVEGD